MAALLSEAATGDAQAWAGLVDAFAATVWAAACSTGLDAAGAASVSRATWLRLVDQLNRIEDADQLGDWLTATARREAERAQRLHKRT